MQLTAYAVFVIAVIILSLTTWLFFYFNDMPLYPGSTLVVVFAWAVVVGGVMWFLRRKAGKRPAGQK